MRHFYTPGYQRIIEEVTDSCEMCTALKQLPKEVFSESTGDIEGFGSNFSADVIERNAQQILIVREKLSSFTFTTFVADQKAETLKSALISLILDLVPQSGCVVALLFLTHKNTGLNKIFYCQNLSSRLGNFYNTPELHMKYPQRSSGDRENALDQSFGAPALLNCISLQNLI